MLSQSDMNITMTVRSSLLIEVYFDGLCQPVNPGGIACYAFVVRKGDSTIHSNYGVVGKPFSPDSTNNVAEYTALIKALEWLIANNLNSEYVAIKSDSKLVVNQLAGTFKVKGKRIIPLYRQVLLLKKEFQKLEVKWVPRDQNRQADQLTNIAYNKALQENPKYFDRALKKDSG